MGPYKCPDCGVWWAGFGHRCAPVITQNGTKVTIGHCHGCSTGMCNAADHVPCYFHRNGWTVIQENVVSYAS